MNAFIKFPTTASSLDTLSWSPSASLLITTPNLIHAMTPKLGSNTSGFSRAEIELPKTGTRPRLEFPGEVEVRPEMIVSEAFIAACWSPLGCSKLGGCLIMAITSRGRAIVYEPEDDPLAGTWSLKHDFTAYILEHVVEKEALKTLEDFQASDITSCAWSAPIAYTSAEDSTTVVSLGTKAGTVLTWKFNQQTFTFLGSIKVTEKAWINKQAWLNSWNDGSNILVAAGTNGAAEILRVKLEHGTRLVETARQSICAVDQCLPTAVRWLPEASGKEAVAVVKSNQLHVCLRDGDGWNALTLSLPTFPPLVGVAWNVDGTELGLTTADGVVYVVSVTPERLEVIRNRTSELYGALIRNGAFEQTGDDEEGEADAAAVAPAVAPGAGSAVSAASVPGLRKDVDKRTALKPYPTQARVYGMCTSRFGTIEGLHLSLQLVAGVEFKIAVRTVSYLLLYTPAEQRTDVVRVLVDRLQDPLLLEKESSTSLALDVVNSMMAEKPQDFGADAMQVDENVYTRAVTHLSPALPSADSAASVAFPELCLPFDQRPQATSASHIGSLRLYWYHNPAVNKARVLNTILSSAKANQESAHLILRNCDAIHTYQIFGVIRCLQHVLAKADLSSLGPDSLKTILTLCDYVLLNPGTFGSLVPYVKAICELLIPITIGRPHLADYDLAPELEIAKAMLSPDSAVPPGLPMREQCPACHGYFALTSPWRAQCGNGHEWERCSVTMAVVDTPYARICTGCHKRIMLPSYYTGGEDGKSVFGDLLRAYDSCVYCGEILALTLKTPAD